MIIFEKSHPFEKKDEADTHKVILIQQFFIHPNKNRQVEIEFCLKKNVDNENIDEIILLNERIYTDKELGVKSSKIKQINVGKRLTYKDIFDIVEKESLTGYIVFSNSDIYFDKSITNLHISKLDQEKHFIGLLRFDIVSPKRYKIFGPRCDSQDTWIFHSNFNLNKKERSIFNFNFGKPGCDNKVFYLMRILGFKIVNSPTTIKSFHLHQTEIRNYSNKDMINMPFIYLSPLDYNCSVYQHIIKHTNNLQRYTLNDNEKLSNYITQKLEKNENFIIPRIAGVENNLAYYGYLIRNNRITEKHKFNQIISLFQTMKNNAGIQFNNIMDLVHYSILYLDAFESCELYAGWDKQGNVYKYIQQSHNFIERTFNKKDNIWSFTYDIFHYIHLNPWTQSLKGKRILIISSFIESIKEKIDIRKEIYGVELFPECEFVFLKPPQTNGSNPSQPFMKELENFCQKIFEVKDDFDVALVSCGGYGNLVCNEIFKMGKSAIYIGGVLQMYFGIYGNRWLRERKDVIRLYLNQYWSRPKETERPNDFNKIENSCYW